STIASCGAKSAWPDGWLPSGQPPALDREPRDRRQRAQPKRKQRRHPSSYREETFAGNGPSSGTAEPRKPARVAALRGTSRGDQRAGNEVRVELLLLRHDPARCHCVADVPTGEGVSDARLRCPSLAPTLPVPPSHCEGYA